MTTESVLQHHLQCFGAGDLNGIISDYAEKSVLFTPNGVLPGTRAIREFFVGMFAELAKPGASTQMLRQDVDGEIAYLVWKGRTADNDYELGTETLVVRGDKIEAQTVAYKVVPRKA